MMNKVIKTLSFIAYFAVAAFSTNAAAAIVIDFSGAAANGGNLSFDGTNATGTDVVIDKLVVEGTDAADGIYVVDALLNFDTAANTITVDGSIAALDIVDSNLLVGSFDTWDYGNNNGVEWFNGGGVDQKSCELLCKLGVDVNTQFEFFGFSMEALNGTITSTDIINTAVPVPATVWLFGSGLLGLVGVARRRA